MSEKLAFTCLLGSDLNMIIIIAIIGIIIGIIVITIITIIVIVIRLKTVSIHLRFWLSADFGQTLVLLARASDATAMTNILADANMQLKQQNYKIEIKKSALCS